ncbi:uncharacterized protein LOC117168701 isoform X2 [Belonocnema kinseyi]|uniref:uncharacterized protein LOC117168701 isoform X2 n=1 Tax=Belonocnema kinseyi TaxID=2817044 RepID=UPI00143D5C1B|nr:uncharacterized protein LOC117168701 isoform X2 [Belonocnema kinseyi]
MKKIHPENLKTSIKVSQETQKKVQGELRSSIFSNIGMMNRHMEHVPNEKSSLALAPKVACPHCDVNCKTYGEFNKYLTNNHGIKIEIENIQFSSMEEF